ncbi:hypothetical protein ACFR99_01560 [Haloarchaeobius amylolyticus]|uniref:DUF8128 domain-containing protein n=1 Tax=Haloarchaeobius amylolyticus TaxID=1198296 RepID=A0ABD6BBG6_9EURY
MDDTAIDGDSQMGFLSRFGSSYVTLDERTAERLSRPSKRFRTVEIHPPFDAELPSTLDRFVRAITEYQTQLLGVQNTSPTIAYEIWRYKPSRVRFQFAVPTARMERKIRTHLDEELPEVGFSEGVNGLPVTASDTVGVGILTPRRDDVYPLRTEFEKPPMNSVATSLHRDAMRDSRIIIQLLFKPTTGGPVRKRLWHHQASRESQGLRSEKVGVVPWHDRDATPREKQQARRIDEKAGTSRFQVTVRILVISAGKYTASRVKEVSGGFNLYAEPETGQSFTTTTVRGIRNSSILKHVKNIRDRRLSHTFQASTDELAALVSVPDRLQENIQYAQP